MKKWIFEVNMKDTSKEALASLGMNLDQTLARFVGNEALLFRFLGRFADDKTFSQLTDAMASGDREQAFHAAHTLKGVAGNLGLDNLFNAVSPLVEALRAEVAADTGAMYAKVKTAYETALSIIQGLNEP